MIKKIFSILLLSILLVSCNINETSSDKDLSTIDSSPNVDNKVYSYIDVTVLDVENQLVCYDNIIAHLDFSSLKIDNIKVGQIYNIKVCDSDLKEDIYIIPDFFTPIYDATLVSEPEYKEDEKMVIFVNRKTYDVQYIEHESITLQSVYFPADTPIKNIIDEYDAKHSTIYTDHLNKMYSSLEGKLLTEDISLYSYYLYDEDNREMFEVH